ncbi:TPA: hypothetical protein ACH3X3_015173 [Trebouxia sp. C0006]
MMHARLTFKRAALALALLIFIAAPVVLLQWDFWLPTTSSHDGSNSNELQLALPVEQVLSVRQQLAYQAYNPQLKPLSGPAQQAHPNPKTQIFPSHTLAILPNFATPQTLASPDGSIVFLQPDSYLHDAQDIQGSEPAPKEFSKIERIASVMPQPKFAPVVRDDLIIALTSAAARQSMIQAERSWRKGVRTHISLDVANPSGPLFQVGRKVHNESFGYYRDLKSNMTVSSPDALRAAMTPFLANQSLGVDSYKWILFGEDDTVFFISNAMKLLEHLDHNLPYLLTDNIQYPQQHINGEQYVAMNPNPRGPRCLPCNYTDPLQGHYQNPHGFNATPACPCTQTAVCQSDNLWLTDQQCRFKFNSPGHGYNFHKESMLTDMLWRKLGLLPTDPGYGYFRPHVRLFDPGWRGPLVRGNRLEITADYGNDPIGLISRVIKKIGPLTTAVQGWCNVECDDQLQHTISTHLDSDHATQSVDMTHVKNSLAHAQQVVPDNQAAAVCFHLTLGDLIEKFDKKQQNRKWFDVYEF